MRIDFYHIDLTKDIKSLKEINSIDTSCNTVTNYSLTTKSNKFDNTDYCLFKDCSEITNLFDSEKELTYKDKEFFSESDLKNLKEVILKNEYNINLKALSMSLVKYIERC